MDEYEQSDPHASFRALRRKVMLAAVVSACCLLVSGWLGWLFQVDGQLEIMRIIRDATGDGEDGDGGQFARILFAGVPIMLMSSVFIVSVPACGWFGAKWV